ncbi:MAG: hydroxymethylpyrimidine/phosphomethylpyrimidine kinase [Gammaproteobacteria bacterium]|nr:hydroxymethylpyrimidine/phosphomethylpyrimidine kinase [Gammaproteobacteria bacterium]MCI0590150.1 hydroxymethylpyrimidine/phosphomethylpyrimidine kinase [Gammaproteobacteria bacterium]
MNLSPHEIPVILDFAGHDPTGGAGIQADIETIASLGGHAASIITALTAQNTTQFSHCVPQEPSRVKTQAIMVLNDMQVRACKLGLLGSIGIVEVIHDILVRHKNIPVVLDPVMASTTGTLFIDKEMQEAIINLLLPHTTVLIPNSLEARQLAGGEKQLDAAAERLMEYGCTYVLITGTHEQTPAVINTLYGDNQRLRVFEWERLPGTYHGSGCTLSAAVAVLLARERDPVNAIAEAQRFTWNALKNGYKLGKGQSHPNRFYWAQAHKDKPR